MATTVTKLATNAAPKKISILGVTGTIGKNTAELILNQPDKYEVEAITANRNVSELIDLALKLRPKLAAIGDESLYAELRDGLSGSGIEVAAGKQSIIDAATTSCDMLVSGIVGIAALEPTLAAVKKGTTIALANKESLVCAGELISNAAKKSKARIIPVDSEHNAIFQSFDFENPHNIRKITLTASGGPFYDIPKEQLKYVTPEQAIKHPNWSMGAKISVDSATMMNKGLEIIEAYYLFPIEKSQIDVIVHPESIVHCLVHYNDGGILAGLSVSDMKVPIAFALGWPERINSQTKELDLAEIGKLTFRKVDEEKFPAISLARKALQQDGTAPIVLNAANEVAVENFLAEKIGFLDIVKLVHNALENIPHSGIDSIEKVLETDQRTRTFCEQVLKGTK